MSTPAVTGPLPATDIIRAAGEDVRRTQAEATTELPDPYDPEDRTARWGREHTFSDTTPIIHKVVYLDAPVDAERDG